MAVMTANPIHVDDGIPRYRQLAEFLRGAVAEGTFKPGDLIPSEQELAIEHQVSIGTVRNAVDGLVKDGILERFSGKGTFVCSPKFDQSLINCFHLYKNSNQRSPLKIDVLKREVMAPSAYVAHNLGILDGGNVISIRRLRLADDVPVLIEDIWLSVEDFSQLMKVPETELVNHLYPIYSKVCGTIVGGIEEILSSQIAEADTANLLNTDPGSHLMKVERSVKDYKGKTFELRQVCGKGDLFHYKIDVK
jgi:GntR family transcriptional regulator